MRRCRRGAVARAARKAVKVSAAAADGAPRSRGQAIPRVGGAPSARGRCIFRAWAVHIDAMLVGLARRLLARRHGLFEAVADGWDGGDEH